MQLPSATIPEPPMNKRERAIEAYEQHERDSTCRLARIEADLATAVTALQTCEYVRLSQQVASLHRELELAKLNHETRKDKLSRELAASCPTCVQQLADDLAAMASRLQEGIDPFDRGGTSQVNYMNIPDDFGDRLAAARKRVSQLAGEPHPEAECARIRRDIMKRPAPPQPKPMTARQDRALVGAN